MVATALESDVAQGKSLVICKFFYMVTATKKIPSVKKSVPIRAATKSGRVSKQKPTLANAETKVAKKTKTPRPATVKVSAKKSATSKAATYKKTSGNNKTMSLVTAPDEKRFWLQNGEVLASLQELADSFAAMDALLFAHHVTKEKNDFAQWVEDVLCDTDCAVSLRRARTPKTARIVIVRSLKKYNV
jgi:hypothetical protein